MPAARSPRWNPRGDGTTVAARTEPAARRTRSSPPSGFTSLAQRPPLVILSAARDLQSGWTPAHLQIPRFARNDRVAGTLDPGFRRDDGASRTPTVSPAHAGVQGRSVRPQSHIAPPVILSAAKDPSPT